MSKNVYLCSHCGNSQPELLSQCPRCGLWDGFSAVSAAKLPSPVVASNAPVQKELNLGVKKTGQPIIDTVMDGGITDGARIVFGGGQGAGKSTLAVQLAGSLAKSKKRVLYVAGEERLSDVQLRFRRLGAGSPNVLITKLIDASAIVELAIKHKCSLVIVDSINTMVDGHSRGEAGSNTQIKAVVRRIGSLQLNSITTVFLAHLNANNKVGGPRWLLHMVDAVLALQMNENGDRVIESKKNRAGRTHVPHDLAMAATGLKIRDVVKKTLPKFEQTQAKLKLMKANNA